MTASAAPRLRLEHEEPAWTRAQQDDAQREYIRRRSARELARLGPAPQPSTCQACEQPTYAIGSRGVCPRCHWKTQPKEQPMTSPKCPVCAGKVPPSNGPRPRKYCSPKCRQRANWRKQNDLPIADSEQPSRAESEESEVEESESEESQVSEEEALDDPSDVEESEAEEDLGDLIRELVREALRAELRAAIESLR